MAASAIPYGPCEEWCALFATWVWEQAGVPIPSYPFTGSIYDWAAANTAVLPPDGRPAAGRRRALRHRALLHRHLAPRGWSCRSGRTGPSSPSRGTPARRRSGSLAVVVNGPYLPVAVGAYNGMPIYAFAAP